MIRADGRQRELVKLSSVKHVGGGVYYYRCKQSKSLGRPRHLGCLDAARLVLVPGTGVAQAAPAGAFARPTQLGGQVLFGNLFGQLRLETLAEDGNLGDGDLVEPGLDERPNGGEEVGSLARAGQQQRRGQRTTRSKAATGA